MKTFHKILILTVLIVTFVLAKELIIFIHNKPYKGEYIYQGNRIYVEIEQFTKMTNLKMYKQGNYYVLSEKTIVPPSSFSSLVYFNNKPLKYVILKDSKVFIDLFEISSFTNSVVQFNKETGIVDYYNKTKIEQTAEQIYKASQEIYKNSQEVYDTSKEIYSSDKKKIQVGEKKTIPADAIKIIEENPQYEDRNNRGELRYYAKIKNTYNETIQEIKVKIKIVTPANEILHEETFKFSSLKPGETREISFYWINNTTIPSPQIKHEIDFKGKEIQEETKK